MLDLSAGNSVSDVPDRAREGPTVPQGCQPKGATEWMNGPRHSSCRKPPGFSQFSTHRNHLRSTRCESWKSQVSFIVNQGGKFLVRRTTMRKRLTAKLHDAKAELQRRMHQPVSEQGRWLQSVVRGYFASHAIPGNWKALGTFRTQCSRPWYRALRHRSQKSRLTWDRMTQIADTWLPQARILHPWPEQRLAALIQGKSFVQQFCP